MNFEIKVLYKRENKKIWGQTPRMRYLDQEKFYHFRRRSTATNTSTKRLAHYLAF